MTTYKEKSFSFGLLCVSFVGACQFVSVLLNLFRFEDGLWLLIV